jgi:photosystem II stability/assembly factor-like uncharacterized protein
VQWAFAAHIESAWEAVTPSTSYGVTPSRLLDCWFLNPKVGWAVGYLELGDESHALALSTRDGGRTWTRLDTGAERIRNGCFDRVFFADDSHGWLCGGSGDQPIDYPPFHLTQFVLRYRP